MQKCFQLAFGFRQRNLLTGPVLKIIYLVEGLTDFGKSMPRYDLAQVNQRVAIEFKKNLGSKFLQRLLGAGQNLQLPAFNVDLHEIDARYVQFGDELVDGFGFSRDHIPRRLIRRHLAVQGCR